MKAHFLRRLPIALVAGLVGLTGAARAASITLPSFSYTYHATFASFDVGDVDITLRPEGAAGCYRYSTSSHPSALVRSLYGAPNETSLFCIDNGHIRSKHFESVLPNNPDKSVTLDFDWSKHQVTDNKGQVRTIPDDAVDNLALQQAVRLWVLAHAGDTNPPIAVMTMVDAKNLTAYHLKLGPHESVTVPAGTFDTFTIERVDNPQKHSKFWLAPSRESMPVKTETTNNGRPTVTLVLVK